MRTLLQRRKPGAAMIRLLAFTLAVAGAAAPLKAAEEHEHHEHEDEHAVGVEEFQKFGVALGTASAGTVDVSIDLPAEIRPNADRLSHLAAPFPGIVRAVHKTVGDSVAAGDVLATIESESLVRYPLKTELAGTVVDKHVTPGETVTRDDHLFIIADLSTVWVEIEVYLDVLPQVHEGQSVRLSSAVGQSEAEGTVSYISPIVDPATRTATARVVLPNSGGRWRPGTFVTASIMDPVAASTVVTRRALHRIEGKDVVFVVDGDHFTPRPVILGRVGRTMAQIQGGLAVGDRYADENSFLVKAELLKGEAEHEH